MLVLAFEPDLVANFCLPLVHRYSDRNRRQVSVIVSINLSVRGKEKASWGSAYLLVETGSYPRSTADLSLPAAYDSSGV